MRNSHAILPNNQRGATLVFALLLLVIIMMFGLPAAMNSQVDERMAGNIRNRDLAFQAAEHALKDAEAFINTQTVEDLNGYFDPPAGPICDDHQNGFLCDGEDHSNDAKYWRDDGTTNTFDWDATGNYRTPAGTLSEVTQQPRYVVERMPEVNYCEANPTQLASTCSGQPTITKYYYRITARGVGKDPNAIVILQTMYEFGLPPASP